MNKSELSEQIYNFELSYQSHSSITFRLQTYDGSIAKLNIGSFTQNELAVSESILYELSNADPINTDFSNKRLVIKMISQHGYGIM